MKKFEYKILTISVSHLRRKNFQEELNQQFANWGIDGWELIKMEPIVTGGIVFQGANTEEFLAIFKRDKV